MVFPPHIPLREIDVPLLAPGTDPPFLGLFWLDGLRWSLRGYVSEREALERTCGAYPSWGIVARKISGSGATPGTQVVCDDWVAEIGSLIVCRELGAPMSAGSQPGLIVQIERVHRDRSERPATTAIGLVGEVRGLFYTEAGEVKQLMSRDGVIAAVP